MSHVLWLVRCWNCDRLWLSTVPTEAPRRPGKGQGPGGFRCPRCPSLRVGCRIRAVSMGRWLPPDRPEGRAEVP
jgi:hypothetical protein